MDDDKLNQMIIAKLNAVAHERDFYFSNEYEALIHPGKKGAAASERYLKRGPRYYKIGRRIIYFKKDVKQWLRSRPVETADSIEFKRKEVRNE